VNERLKKITCCSLFGLSVVYAAFVLVQFLKHGFFGHYRGYALFLIRWSIYFIPFLFLVGLAFFASQKKKPALSIVLLVLASLVQLLIIYVVASFFNMKIMVEDLNDKLNGSPGTRQSP
jgi:hypothetical protein